MLPHERPDNTPPHDKEATALLAALPDAPAAYAEWCRQCLAVIKPYRDDLDQGAAYVGIGHFANRAWQQARRIADKLACPDAVHQAIGAAPTGQWGLTVDECAARLAAVVRALGSTTTPSLTAPFLNLHVDRENRVVRRDGHDGAVEFGKKEKPWRLFVQLFDARDDGYTRDDLTRMLVGVANPNNLDQWKGRCNELLGELRVEILPDQRGLWKLAEI